MGGVRKRWLGWASAAAAVLLVMGCKETVVEMAVADLAAPAPDLDEGCSSDSDCRSSAWGPRCDTTRHACVECLPIDDNCPLGGVCQQINGEFRCSCGCASNADCQKLGGGSLCCSCVCINPSADSDNCGACGSACPAVANGSRGCSFGVCGIAACNTGFGDCDRLRENGCEHVVSDDTENCGACGVVCAAGANAKASCEKGVCGVVCASGYGDCDRDEKNGCESDLLGSKEHCGGCQRACAVPPNGTVECVGGVCVSGCQVGFANCDGLVGNGCEVDLQRDAGNCGACGNRCGGGTSCKMGRCG